MSRPKINFIDTVWSRIRDGTLSFWERICTFKYWHIKNQELSSIVSTSDWTDRHKIQFSLLLRHLCFNYSPPSLK